MKFCSNRLPLCAAPQSGFVAAFFSAAVLLAGCGGGGGNGNGDRLVGTWRAVSETINGATRNCSNSAFCENSITLRFNADGTGTATFPAFGTRSEVRGRWKREGDRLTLTGTHFAEDENGNGSFESGEVSALDEPEIQTLEIESLTSETLVVEDLDDTGSDEIHTTFERQ